MRTPPAEGWIREIRDALGMTSRELAARMHQSQPAVTQLEQSEISGRVQLNSLRNAAAALDCELVYAIVPRTTLEDTVLTRARTLAERELAASDMVEGSIEHYASRLVEGGHLWDDRNAD